jgi:hypothetical protein
MVVRRILYLVPPGLDRRPGTAAGTRAELYQRTWRQLISHSHLQETEPRDFFLPFYYGTITSWVTKKSQGKDFFCKIVALKPFQSSRKLINWFNDMQFFRFETKNFKRNEAKTTEIWSLVFP